MMETEEPQRQLSQLAPVPRPTCSTLSAHILDTRQLSPNALPTARGGSPGKPPCFHRPMGLVDEEGAQTPDAAEIRWKAA